MTDQKTVADVAQQADEITTRLAEGERTWARTTTRQRRELLRRLAELTDEHSAEWVRVAAGIKGLAPDSPLVGEEWISGPWAVLSYVDPLARTMERLERGTDLLEGVDTRAVPGGRVALEVLPHTIFDTLLLNGFHAEVWMQPGITVDEARATAGLGAREPEQTQGTALVLGAGNIFSIAPLDTLYQLYADNRVVVLKLNPLTDPLLPVFERIFAPFIELGVFEIVTGGIEIGEVLAQHPQIAAVHLTGSERTHDAIVWGTGVAGQAAKAAGTPRLAKPMTSELGGVAPAIVVPGRWSKADLAYQARHIATQRLHNSGSNCIAAQVVVLSSDWDQKDDFLRELRSALAEAPQRPAWYPGSTDRVQDACTSHPGADSVSETRALLPGLDLGDAEEPAFSVEYFAPVLGVATLPGTGAAFLQAAVDASNHALRGTLGANVVIHPRTRREIGDDFESAVADLHYGTIGINAWTGVGYLTPCATWGAFPGHPLDDVQSGIGVVHNALLLTGTERTVVEGPFRPAPRSVLRGEWTIMPKPPWFIDNRTAATTGRRLSSFAARPRWSALPGIFASALRG